MSWRLGPRSRCDVSQQLRGVAGDMAVSHHPTGAVVVVVQLLLQCPEDSQYLCFDITEGHTNELNRLLRTSMCANIVLYLECSSSIEVVG